MRALGTHFAFLFVVLGLLLFGIDGIVLSRSCSHLLKDLSGDKRLKVKAGLDNTAEFVTGKPMEIVPVKLRVHPAVKYGLLLLAAGSWFLADPGKSGTKES